jgi:hypothetical protein
VVRLRRIDVFLNPLEGDDWVSRRHENLRLPATDVIGRTVAHDDLPPGLPYLVPEVQLLTVAQRRWLREMLKVHPPGDAWIRQL